MDVAGRTCYARPGIGHMCTHKHKLYFGPVQNSNQFFRVDVHKPLEPHLKLNLSEPSSFLECLGVIYRWNWPRKVVVVPLPQIVGCIARSNLYEFCRRSANSGLWW